MVGGEDRESRVDALVGQRQGLGDAANSRWERRRPLTDISSDGSIGTTARSVGSYEPDPAPMFTTEAASPSAARIARAILGSAWRVSAYAPPIRS